MQALDPLVQRFGPLELRVTQRELLVDGRPVPVRGRAWDVLLALVERRDRVVGKQELLDLVWPDAAVEEGNLQTHISALRRHIGRSAIATVPGRGYRFVLAPSATAADVSAGTGSAGALLGRAAEREALARAIDAGALALLCGEAGIGKSRLLADLQQTHPLGARAFVLAGARPGDGATPYATVARLLRRVAARLAAPLPDALRHELARAVPEWGTPAPASEGEGRARLAQACARLLADAVRQGVRALLLDDLHFADDASIGLLQPLIDERVCAWALAAREHELHPAARAVFDAQAALSTTLRLSLPPLDLGSVDQMLAAFGHPAAQRPGRAQALWRHTGGNPLFVIETLQLARSQGRDPAPAVGGAVARVGATDWPQSDQVKRVIRRRLATLSAGAMRLLRCAAVAGDDLDPALAAALLGTTPLALADDWAELEAAQVLRGCAFAHDLVAEAVRDEVPLPIAASLHGPVAAWLEQQGAEPSRVAAHWLASATPQRAVPALLAAAQRASRASCPAQAYALYVQAGDMLVAAGDRAAAFDAWFAAADVRSELAIDDAFLSLCDRLLAVADGDDARLAMAGLARLATLIESRRHDEALAASEQALMHAQRASLPDVEAELLWGQVIVHWERRELAAASQRAQRALARLAQVDARHARLDTRSTHQKLVQILGKLQVAAGDYDAAATQLAAAHQLALAGGETGNRVASAIAMAGCSIDRGDAAGARAALQAQLDALDGRDWDRAVRAQALGLLARLHLACGDPTAAAAASEQSLALCTRSHVRHEIRLRREHLALAHRLGRADVPAALQGLRALPGIDPMTDALLEATRQWAGGLADPAHGDEASALLSQAAGCPDLPLRAELLCLLQHVPATAGLALLLQIQTTQVQAASAPGLGLSLACAQVAVLLRLGQAAQAAAAARLAWPQLASGLIPAFGTFADAAAPLHQALATADAPLAEAIALRASAWAQKAAASMPPELRRTFLASCLQGFAMPVAPGARQLAARRRG